MILNILPLAKGIFIAYIQLTQKKERVGKWQ